MFSRAVWIFAKNYFHPKDGNSIFLRNFRKFLPQDTASTTNRQYSFLYCLGYFQKPHKPQASLIADRVAEYDIHATLINRAAH
jgi:hypothetical protein